MVNVPFEGPCLASREYLRRPSSPPVDAFNVSISGCSLCSEKKAVYFVDNVFYIFLCSFRFVVYLAVGLFLGWH